MVMGKERRDSRTRPRRRLQGLVISFDHYRACFRVQLNSYLEDGNVPEGRTMWQITPCSLPGVSNFQLFKITFQLYFVLL
ncbi:hypothetical protein GQ55_8G262600 [Panicum hallii var. hallii]|uniref:Uncharacterized protein n=1 Tax=Panicum hallii var. hallii TaxID=1504633 RepID=A0A2T7CRF5_9POAL|nr:hypothetical protein GQ55_8G262600 [Panicum hallii var. hallii]